MRPRHRQLHVSEEDCSVCAARRTNTERSCTDEELVSLRDEIGEARREDVAALVAQMER
jgi:hypothetical protein